MIITRVATWKRAEQGDAIALTVDGRTIAISHAQLATLDTEAKLKTAVETAYGDLLDVFFHYNDDGSVAMATGAEPSVWPEDDEE